MKQRYAHALCLLALTLLTHTALQAQQACALDPAWDTDGKLVADGSRLGDHIVVQPDGKILVACNPFGDSHAYVKRFNPDGSVDASYGTNGSFSVQVAERRTDIDGMALHDGILYLCGSTTTDIGGTNTYVYAAAVETNGGWHNTFGTGGVRKFNTVGADYYTAGDIGVDANGKIYVTGLEWLDNIFVVRLHANGTLDNAWDGDGAAYVATNDANKWFEINDLEFDKNGQVLITGKKYKANNGSPGPAFWNLMVARFTSSGSLDGSFATAGIGLYNSDLDNFDEGKRIAVTPSNDYVVIGNTYDNVDYDYSVVKVLQTGVVDPAFGTAGWSVNDLEMNNEMEYCLNGMVMADGRILATGNQGSGDTVHFSLLALTPTGQRDNAFAPNGLFVNIFNQNNNSSSSGMAMTDDGKIYLGGYTRTCVNGNCGPLYMALSRYFGGTPAVGVDAPHDITVSVFPNPVMAGQQLRIQGVDMGDVHEITLTDMSGRVVAMQPAGDRFTVPAVAAGIYLYRIVAAEKVYTSKVVVR
jgi:uncharacterized delta-60 repeat protein